MAPSTKGGRQHTNRQSSKSFAKTQGKTRTDKNSSDVFIKNIMWTLKKLWSIIFWLLRLIWVSCVKVWHYLNDTKSENSLALERAKCISSSKQKIANVQNAQVNAKQVSRLVENYHWSPSPVSVEKVGWLSMMKCNPFMGTLHSFIGHASQWCKMSPQIETQWNALPAEVKTLVNKVEGSKLSEEGFFAALAKLNLSSRIFSGIEKEVNRFFSKNATRSNFIGESETKSGKKQVCFSVTDKSGRSCEMVLGVPSQQYTTNIDGTDQSTRMITTAFFRPSAKSFFSSFFFQWLLLPIILFSVSYLLKMMYF